MESKFAKFKRMCNEASLIEVEGARIFTYVAPPSERPSDDMEVVFEAEWGDGEGQTWQVRITAEAIDDATITSDGKWLLNDDNGTSTTIQFFQAVPIVD